MNGKIALYAVQAVIIGTLVYLTLKNGKHSESFRNNIIVIAATVLSAMYLHFKNTIYLWTSTALGCFVIYDLYRKQYIDSYPVNTIKVMSANDFVRNY